MTSLDELINNQLSSCRKWCAKPFNHEFCFQEPTDKLKAAIKCRANPIHHELSHLSTWFGHAAIVKIWDAHNDGVEDLGRFAELWWLYFRFSEASPGFWNVCLCALLHLGLRSHEKAAWLLERIDEDHPSHRFYLQPHYNETMRYPLEFYCKALRGKRNGRTPSASDIEKCGAFADIFRQWDNLEGLASAIRSLCDYHLNRTGEPMGYEIYEFNHTPYTLIPVEILALRVVREELGLETPEVDHPLLTTPLMKNLPAVLPEMHDELLDKLKVVLEETYATHSPTAGMNTGPESPAEPPIFSTGELTERTGLFRKEYGLIVTLRFTEGETLDSHWPRVLGAIAEWRAKRGKSGEMLNVIFQSGPDAHPDLYRAFADRIEADADLDAWTGELRDYTLSFQLLDGTDCRDLIRERQPDGSYLLFEMKFTPME